MRISPLHSLALVASILGACIDDEPDPDLNATEQHIVMPCARVGLYDASQSQPWNTKGVTVFDVRRCDSGDHLDGTFVAQQIGFIKPGFPDLTNPGGTVDGSYRVFFPDAAHANGKLLIFLPGSGDQASVANKEQLLQRAAYDGYHVLAIRYWNTDASETGNCGKAKSGPGSAQDKYTFDTLPSYDTCNLRSYVNRFTNWGKPYDPAVKLPSSGSTKCYEDAAENAAATFQCTGTPEGNALTDGDPVLFRVRALLKYLVANRPSSEQWDSFRAPGNGSYQTPPYLDWKRVALMGHSTGSKILFNIAHDGPRGAANAADDVLFDRVIFLSGPNLADASPAGLTGYAHSPGKTPLDRIYAFSNKWDQNFPRARETWATMSGPATAGSSTTVVGLKAQVTHEGARKDYETVNVCSPGMTDCHGCGEHHPLPPDLGMPYRSLTYRGNVAWCTATDGAAHANGEGAHTSTTSDDSCRGSTPDTCWYRAIWDYMLTNPTP